MPTPDHIPPAIAELTAKWPNGAWKEGESPESITGQVGQATITLVRASINWMAFCGQGKGMAKTPVAAIENMR